MTVVGGLRCNSVVFCPYPSQQRFGGRSLIPLAAFCLVFGAVFLGVFDLHEPHDALLVLLLFGL